MGKFVPSFYKPVNTSDAAAANFIRAESRPLDRESSRRAQRPIEGLRADNAPVLFIREDRANPYRGERMIFTQLRQASARLEGGKYPAVSIRLGSHV
jgi:hypothetical protein